MKIVFGGDYQPFSRCSTYWSCWNAKSCLAFSAAITTGQDDNPFALIQDKAIPNELEEIRFEMQRTANDVVDG
jgi:hypothetical protein